MTEPQFDPVIHPPARLQIMAVLAGVQEAEFALLREAVKVSDSVLSKHLSQLSDAGYVTLKKASRGGHLRTWAAITREGRRAFAGHVEALQSLVAAAQRTPPA